jgi:hypothetical protein
MKIEVANDLSEFINDNGYECSVNEHYSGRGMYGKTTAAIYVNAHPSIILGLVLIHLETIKEDYPDLSKNDETFDSDSMGLGYVIY